MKAQKEGLDFKFLNTIMYVGAIIAIFYFLQSIGVMDKIVEGLVALIPVYVGIIICWMSMPLANKLRKLGLNKYWSAIVALVIIFGILAILLSFVIPMFADQLSSLVKDLPNIYRNIVEKINWILTEQLGVNQDKLITTDIKNLDVLQQNLGNIVNYSITTLQSVFNVLVVIGTSVVISFFMVKDVGKFKAGLVSFFTRNSKDRNKHKMLVEIDDTLMSYIKGIVIDSFIVGVLTTIACMILGLNYAVVFGILFMVLNLIPYIGAIISELVAALYALTVGGPILALITFAALFAIQIIDANILQPNIVAKSVKLHPVVVLSGLMVFNVFFGIFGMLIAVPVLGVLKVVLKYKFSLPPEEEKI